MLRQQRKHFAAMLAAALLASRKIFWPQLLAVKDVWEQMLGSELFAAHYFLGGVPPHEKTFPENHVIAC